MSLQTLTHGFSHIFMVHAVVLQPLRPLAMLPETPG
jgi:hypothetical protein